MIWPFRRRKPVVPVDPSPVHVGPVDLHWAPGDIAECIDDGAMGDVHPRIGQRLLVTGAVYGVAAGGQTQQWFLYLVGMPLHIGYAARCFRKIVLTDTGADRKVGKRVPVAEPA